MNTQPTNVNTRVGNTRFLDGLRGIAALYVLLFHARWLLWEGFAEGYAQHPERYTLVARLIAYSSLTLYYGHQAVILFFVLSGFVIHLRYARLQAVVGNELSWAKQPRAAFDLRHYASRRARRIFPVAILALLVTYALDMIGRNNGFLVYDGRTRYALINAVGSQFNLSRLATSLTLIPGAPEWGSNIPLWSLRYEWFFYLIYPALWWLRQCSLWAVTAAVLALCVLSFVPGLWAWPVGEPLRLTFSLLIVWWFGALLAECYVGTKPLPLRRIAPLGLLLFPLLVSVEPFFRMDETLRDILWGAGFTGLMAWLLSDYHGYPVRTVRTTLDKLRKLGGFSYTLYAIHFPILFLLSGYLISRSPEGALPSDYAWIVFGSLMCVLVAWGVSLVVERPFTTHRG